MLTTGAVQEGCEGATTREAGNPLSTRVLSLVAFICPADGRDEVWRVRKRARTMPSPPWKHRSGKSSGAALSVTSPHDFTGHFQDAEILGGPGANLKFNRVAKPGHA